MKQDLNSLISRVVASVREALDEAGGDPAASPACGAGPDAEPFCCEGGCCSGGCCAGGCCNTVIVLCGCPA